MQFETTHFVYTRDGKCVLNTSDENKLELFFDTEDIDNYIVIKSLDISTVIPNGAPIRVMASYPEDGALATQILTLKQAIDILENYWKREDIEPMLRKGQMLWTPYATYQAVDDSDLWEQERYERFERFKYLDGDHHEEPTE